MLTECQPRLVPVGWDAGYSHRSQRTPDPGEAGESSAPAPAPGAHLAPGQWEEAGGDNGGTQEISHTRAEQQMQKTSTRKTNVTASLFGIKLTTVFLRFWISSSTLTLLTSSLVVAASVK